MIVLILDGYNVIHAVPELARHLDRSLQAAREALVRLCQEYRARRGDIERLYVVFDGRDAEAFGSSAQPQSSVTVLFTQRPEEADARILRVVEEHGRGRCVVVSNDNEVANNARAFGARILSVQTFYRQVHPVKTSHLQSPASPGKTILSTRDAQQITDEYRQHLDHKTKATQPR